MKDINYPLVESKRPPIYTSMKYWGKKPHNIWNKYINVYTSKNGCYLDPFTGSAMSAIESIRSNKKTFAFDINPLSSFVIEVMCSEFNKTAFTEKAMSIIEEIKSSQVYKENYTLKDSPGFYIHNFKWDEKKLYEVCLESDDKKKRVCLSHIEKKIDYDPNIQIDFIHPTKKFRKTSSFNKSFLDNIGTTYDKLWSRRSLLILSIIFEKICEVTDENVRIQLLYSFIQIVHLCSKMCVPRSKKSNRDFSTSWGRSAYLYSKKQMEMNPLLLFESACFGKQSTSACLEHMNSYLSKKPIIKNVNKEKYDPNSKADLWYGVVDIKSIDEILPEKSIDFILTDPPYGGLVQYLDLSSIWLSWLELYSPYYSPQYDCEITINNIKNSIDFETDFSNALKKLNFVLKDNSKLVLTFNNKNASTWNAFLHAIDNSGFRIENVVHQQNKRTSESNVSDIYGMAASDFYIRCVKKDSSCLVAKKKNIDLIELITEILEKVGEPVRYQTIFNEVFITLSISNTILDDIDENVMNTLKNNEGNIFEIVKNLDNDEKLWWLKDKKINRYKSLTFKLEKFISSMFENEKKISEEKILEEIYLKFRKLVIPDYYFIHKVLKKKYIKSSEYWEVK